MNLDSVKMPYKANRKIKAAQKKIGEAYRLLEEAEEELRKEFGDYVAGVFDFQHSVGLYYGTCDWDDEVLRHWVYKASLKNTYK